MSETRNLFWRACAGLTARDQRNQWVAVGWLFAWQLTFLAATIALKRGLVPAGAAATAVALVPTVLGVVMLFAYRKFLAESDELQRKIQLDALALGFGSGIVATVAHQLLQGAGVVAAIDISGAAAFMMVVYAIGIVLGTRRYA